MKMQGWTWKYVIEILKNGDTVTRHVKQHKCCVFFKVNLTWECQSVER